MSSTAARLVDHVLPLVPIRHCVLTLPEPIRFLIVYRPELIDVCLFHYTRTLFEWTTERAGGHVDPSTGCGAVTVVQRFSGNLQLFIHFHTLLLSGVFEKPSGGALRFRELPPPTTMDLHDLQSRLATRLVRAFERRGLLEEGEIVVPSEEFQAGTGLESCQAASVQNRIAFGPRAGLRVRRELDEEMDGNRAWGGRATGRGGLTIFIGDAIPATSREVMERLARYISRPPVSDDRLSLTPDGDVRLEFRRPHADGARAIILSPLEFIERLAALVAPPRKNLIRYHGILSPNACWRPLVVPAHHLPSPATRTPIPGDDPTFAGLDSPDGGGSKPRGRPRWIPWALLLRRVFGYQVLLCDRCHGVREVLAFLVHRPTVKAILDCLGLPSVPPRIRRADWSRALSPAFGD